MILSGLEIIREWNNGKITISPFSEDQINPNSYNYRLGFYYVELDEDEVLDPLGDLPNPEPCLIPQEGMILQPNKLYLCHTLETLGSEEYVTSLIGKSSMGRLGLFLQVSANLGHQAQVHQWTLELRCCLPIKIYPGMIIGQVTFWKPCGEIFNSSYGYYGFIDMPSPSKGTIL